ncbi:MAG TPA: hypothetical protein VF175_07280, partial [Lacipirellula sp.]
RPDVAIEDVLVEDVVFPGDRLQLEASVRSTGYAGQKAAVVLKRAGTEESLAETQVELPADGEPTTVRLALRPSEPGPMPLVVEAEGRAGEDDLANNRVELTLDVRDRPIRTLLVDSSPSFEFRALKSLLERDPAIDLRVWLQDADADYADVDEASLRAFPATEADWLEYDVVILGDVDPELLPRQTWDLLHKFVSMHGGGLVLIAGQRHTPRALADREAMQSLLPIDVSGQSASPSSAPTTAGVRVTPTSAGLRDAMLQLGDTMEESLAIWRELPPLLWFYEPLRVKPGVQILATTASESGDAASQPVIMRHYVGAGEVLMHATDETWRWRWRNDDRYFARYWGQAVRRLARGRATRGVGTLSTNRTEYQPGDPVTIRLRLGAARDQAGAAQTIELLGHSTPTREIRLRRRGAHARIFEATLHDLPADRYTARVGGSNSGEPSLSTEFTISAPPSELSRLAVNTAGLQAAAKATGGKFYTTKTAARLPEELPAARPTAVERLPEEPLWNSHGLLAVVCVALAAEWFLRRRSGLL